jgi:hypothetical protein
MKTFFLIFFLFSMEIHAQDAWSKTEIANNLFAYFPSQPEYSVESGMSVYLSITENTSIIVQIKYGVIPSNVYTQINQQTLADQDYVYDKLLTGVTNGMLSASGNPAGSNKSFLFCNGVKGMKSTYQSINPRSGKKEKCFALSLFLKNQNKLCIIMCFVNSDNGNSVREKDLFYDKLKCNF